MNTRDNKRRQDRIESFLIVEYKSGKNRDYFTGITRELSCEGFSMESQCFEYALGEVLDIRLRHTQSDVVVKAAGEVVWTKQAWYKYIVGIKFRKINEEVTAKLTQLISVIANGPDAPAPFYDKTGSMSMGNREEGPKARRAGIIDGLFLDASELRNKDKTAASTDDRGLNKPDYHEPESEKEMLAGDMNSVHEVADMSENPSRGKGINISAGYLTGKTESKWTKKRWIITPVITILAVIMFIALPLMIKNYQKTSHPGKIVAQFQPYNLPEHSIADHIQKGADALVEDIKGEDAATASDENMIVHETSPDVTSTAQTGKRPVSGALQDEGVRETSHFSTEKIEDTNGTAVSDMKKPSLKDVIARIDSTFNSIHGNAPQNAAEDTISDLKESRMGDVSGNHTEAGAAAVKQKPIHTKGISDGLRENLGQPKADVIDMNSDNLNHTPALNENIPVRADSADQGASVKETQGITTASTLHLKNEPLNPERSQPENTGPAIGTGEKKSPEAGLVVPQGKSPEGLRKNIALLIPPRSAAKKQEKRVALLVPKGEPAKKVQEESIALLIPPKNTAVKQENKVGLVIPQGGPVKAQDSKIALLVPPRASAADHGTELLSNENGADTGLLRIWKNIGTTNSGISLSIDSGHIVNRPENVVQLYMRTSVENAQFDDLIEINCKLSKLRLMEKRVSSNPALLSYSDEWSAITPGDMLLYNSICL